MSPSKHHHRGSCLRSPCLAGFLFVEKLFWAAAATCLLYAVHRIATALKLQARVKVLDELGDALSDEEREQLVGRVKARALSL